MKKTIYIETGGTARMFYTNISGEVVVKVASPGDEKAISKKFTVPEFLALLGLDGTPERKKKYPSPMEAHEI
jgi:hypothetical protein